MLHVETCFPHKKPPCTCSLAFCNVKASLYFICANFKFFLTYELITIAVGWGKSCNFMEIVLIMQTKGYHISPVMSSQLGEILSKSESGINYEYELGEGSFSLLFCSGKIFNMQLLEQPDIERQHLQMSWTHCDHVSGCITAQSHPMEVQPHTRSHNSICSSF